MREEPSRGIMDQELFSVFESELTRRNRPRPKTKGEIRGGFERWGVQSDEGEKTRGSQELSLWMRKVLCFGQLALHSYQSGPLEVPTTRHRFLQTGQRSYHRCIGGRGHGKSRRGSHRPRNRNFRSQIFRPAQLEHPRLAQISNSGIFARGRRQCESMGASPGPWRPYRFESSGGGYSARLAFAQNSYLHFPRGVPPRSLLALAK